MSLLQARKSELQAASESAVGHRLCKLSDTGRYSGEDLAPSAYLRALPVGAEFLSLQQGIASVWALRSGWAGHIEQLADGRRQIVHLVLPGEIIAYPRLGRPVSSITVIALTPVQLCIWRIADDQPLAAAQRAALGASDALEHRCMTNQIARIGRRTAYERVVHLLLEIRDRLGIAGDTPHDRFALPLTQELLADVLGLTSVHINRTLQQLRQHRHIEFHAGMVHLRDLDQLARIADYRPLLPA